MIWNTFKQVNWRAYLMIFLFAFVSSFVLGSCPLWGVSTKTDSAVFLTIVNEIANGKVMYLDLFDHKGPLLYLINFIAYRSAGFMGLWVCEILFLTVTMMFSYKTVMLLCNDSKTSLLSLVLSYSFFYTYIETGNYTEEFALVFISIGLYYFTKIFMSNLDATRWQVVILGVSFAGTLLLRPNMFALWAAFCIMLFVLYIYHKRVQELLIAMLFFLIGAVLFVLPFIVYLCVNHAMADYIYQCFTFNSKYTAMDFSSLSGFASFIQLFLENISSCLGRMIVGIPALLALLWALIKKESNVKLYYVAVFTAIVFTILMISVANGLHGHYFLVLVPLLVPVHCGLFQHCNLKAIEGSALVKCLLIVVLLGVYMFGNLLYFVEGFFRVEDAQYIEVAQYIAENSDDDDEMIMVGKTCKIYVYANRNAASKYVYQDPIATVDSTIAAEFEAEIVEAMPMFVVGIEEYFGQYSEICAMLAESYQEPVVIGEFLLYQLR